MTKVYKIKQASGYQYFLPENQAEWDVLEGRCKPKAATWEPPSVFVFEPFLKEGDFYQFGNSKLIASPRATKALLGHFQIAGELLPLPHEGTEYTLLNVTECINSLHQERTEWHFYETGERGLIAKYAFHPDRFTESTIFKIPEMNSTEILVVEGLHDPEDEFRYAVERAELKGLLFEELWSDEG